MSDNKNKNQQVEELDINHLMQVRREKLKELQEQGKDRCHCKWFWLFRIMISNCIFRNYSSEGSLVL